MHPSYTSNAIANQISAEVDRNYLCRWWRHHSVRYLGFDLHDNSEEILNNLVSRFGPCLFYLCELGVGVFAGVFFSFLVAAGVLMAGMLA